VLGGSEGGGSFARDRAPRFASRGFAVLGLPYYSPGRGEREIPELPAAFADIPVERLDTAFEWLKHRPEVDASRVALLGASKGAEFVLLAASKLRWIASAVDLVKFAAAFDDPAKCPILGEKMIAEMDSQPRVVATEGDRYWASVRFTGSTREGGGAPQAFDEVWNLSKPTDGSSGWLLAGIQQQQLATA